MKGRGNQVNVLNLMAFKISYKGCKVGNSINSTVIEVNTISGNSYTLENSQGFGWFAATRNPNV
jgi:hypothetical protein